MFPLATIVQSITSADLVLETVEATNQIKPPVKFVNDPKQDIKTRSKNSFSRNPLLKKNGKKCLAMQCLFLLL